MHTPYAISVVVPVFNEADGLRAFHERASKALEALPGARWELVYVDDGSSDGSFEQLAALTEDDARIGVVRLSRNFGHQVAISAGLDRARGDCAVVIDADLQDPPEVIARLVEKWREGFDVVYGVRSRRRGDGALTRLAASAFYRLLDRVTGIRIPVDAGDFRLLSRRALRELKRLPERDRYVRGLVSWIGFAQAGVAYERDERLAGESKYPYRKRLELALAGITSFSTAPLRAATWLGIASAVGAVVGGLAALAQGAALLAMFAGLVFLASVQLACFGLIGAFLARLMIEVKARPMYVVADERAAADPAGGRATPPG